MNRRGKDVAILALGGADRSATVGLGFLSFARKVDTLHDGRVHLRRATAARWSSAVDRAERRRGARGPDARATGSSSPTARPRPRSPSPEKQPRAQAVSAPRCVVLSPAARSATSRSASPRCASTRPTSSSPSSASCTCSSASSRSRASRTGAARGLLGALPLLLRASTSLTPAGPRDAIVEGVPGSPRIFFRAFLPALLLHFFLIFPRPRPRRRVLPLLYAAGRACTSAAELPVLAARPSTAAAALLEGATRFWFVYFAVYGSAVLSRLSDLLRRRREDAEAEKQVRWIGLGVDRRASRPSCSSRRCRARSASSRRCSRASPSCRWSSSRSPSPTRS